MSNLKAQKYRSKTNTKKRMCIGIECRGRKSFMSYEGARLCDSCKKLIVGMPDVIQRSYSKDKQ